MKNFPPTDGSDDSQNEEIIYEEVVGGSFPPKGGRIPPVGRFAPPPFGGYVIEEEIIEEIEEDPTESGDSENAKQQETSVSEPKVSAEKANAPKERPAPPRAAPKPKPYKAFKAAVKPAPKNDYDKIHREKKTSKFIVFDFFYVNSINFEVYRFKFISFIALFANFLPVLYVFSYSL